MKKYLFAALLLCAGRALAVPTAVVAIPHITFVDGAGDPCAGCRLYTYAAGTTTPLATYTDASGGPMNTNPIVLDAAGGANIWVGSSAYKFILKDAQGATIWSVDQVTAGGSLFQCAAANAVLLANSSATGSTCDANITINTTNHTISVGTLGPNYVTIGAVGTPTSWTFDTTTPATALASLGGASVAAGTMNQIAIFPAAGTALAGASALPAGITVITQSPGDSSTNPASTAYVALPGAIAPTSVVIAAGSAMTDNQGTGAKVQHSTGATTTGHGAEFDASGNVVDSGFAFPGPIAGVQNNVTGSRALGTVYQNTNTSMVIVHGFFATGGSAFTNLEAFTGSTSTPTDPIWGAQYGATTSGDDAGFSFPVPAGYYYKIVASGSASLTLVSWYETAVK